MEFMSNSVDALMTLAWLGLAVVAAVVLLIAVGVLKPRPFTPHEEADDAAA